MRKTILIAVLVVVLVAAMVGGATMAWFTDSDSSEPVEFSAGTLLVGSSTVMMYGVEQDTGDLYEIDVVNGKKFLLFDGTTNSGDENYPNGLAFDRNNNRLYYSGHQGNAALRFYDFASKTEIFAGNLIGRVAGAAFGLGSYWYVPNGTANLYKVSFDVDGKIVDKELVAPSFTTGSFGFGDLALDIRDGIIYGSSTNGKFFKIDLRDEFRYQEIRSGIKGPDNKSLGLQLAFAADGNLYGHATHFNDQNWYRIDTSNGVLTLLDWVPANVNNFTDLASNYQNNWNPGDCDKVKYVFENMGTKNMVFRFTPEFDWEADPENKYIGEDNVGIENITVSLCASTTGDYVRADWQEVNSTFYYVGDPLTPGEKAALCLNICLDGPDTSNYYQGATLTFEGEVEAIQSSNNGPNEYWGVNFYN